MSLNLLNFISHFLSKKCFLSAWEILGFARFLAGFCHLALLCRSCKRYEKFFKFTHKAPVVKLLISKNRAKYPQDAPQQKLSILLLKPRHSTICRRISSFSKIYTKSSKKSGMLATLVKFNQALNSHLPRQWKFVKTNALYTRHKMLQASVNLLAYQ